MSSKIIFLLVFLFSCFIQWFALFKVPEKVYSLRKEKVQVQRLYGRFSKVRDLRSCFWVHIDHSNRCKDMRWSPVKNLVARLSLPSGAFLALTTLLLLLTSFLQSMLLVGWHNKLSVLAALFIFYFGTRVSLISSINPFDLVSFLLVGFSAVSKSVCNTNLALILAFIANPLISPLVLMLLVLHNPSYKEFILYAAPLILVIYGMYGAKVVYNPIQLVGLVSGFGFALYGLKSFALIALAFLELNQGFATLGALTLIHYLLLFAFKSLCQQNS